MGVMGSSIAQVFYPRAAKADREGNLSKVTLDMFERLLAIGFVPLMLIAVVAPDLFALVFGERWWTAGEYVRWMSLWLFFQFVSSPLSTLYYVMGRQSNLLTFNVIMFVTRLLVIIVGGLRGDVLLTIILMGITGTVLYALLCMHITKVAGSHFAKILLVIFKRVMYSIPYGLFPLTVWYVSSSSFAFVSAAVASGCIFLVKEVYHMNKSGLLI
jgi:O-antigen/teichoic acid export membrane protein